MTRDASEAATGNRQLATGNGNLATHRRCPQSATARIAPATRNAPKAHRNAMQPPHPRTSASSLRTVFQFRPVPRVPSLASMSVFVRRERPMPSGYEM